MEPHLPGVWPIRHKIGQGLGTSIRPPHMRSHIPAKARAAGLRKALDRKHNDISDLKEHIT